jgi:hypothetical protein
MDKAILKLITHLQNLHKQGVKQTTLDVQFLLTALGQEVPSAPTQTPRSDTLANVDGGSFKD